ncbi:2-amino-4-hydroxy-6-hydroxymethyldihydropteridine diphosphokinase [Synechococcus sp. PCC 7336]|uniref:2-amino-4-hydroxy-6- hydroxymethyldihydropteridine diphosphokinase n=1 Tax=Synechococcus sp. PCC 7336 TaxID=195250 RepID=UPI000A05ACF2|nr:2-amino-4-hydroxy-6-hydroxymethyldihydropteridine diphosphokinase [Synechococcus sp. PCC 7336]
MGTERSSVQSNTIQPNANRIPQTGYSPSRAVVAIALGSNLGDPRQNLEAGLMALQNHPDIELLQVSPCFWTEPVYWGDRPQQESPAYLNGAALLATSLLPPELMRVLLQVEAQLGRARHRKWDSRTLDLDILLWEDRWFEGPDAIVPHPRMAERAFVLVPLKHLIPHWRYPEGDRQGGATIAELVQRVSWQGVAVERPVQLLMK